MDKELIVFIATAWGSRHGGINSCNEDLSKALASVLLGDKHEIVCIVQNYTEAELNDASSCGVRLLSIPSLRDNKTDVDCIDDSHAEEILATVQDNVEGDVTVWVGHDVITGFAAVRAKDYVAGSR